MGHERRNGDVVTAVGAAALAISVFLPWYGLSFSAQGAGAVRQETTNLAQQYGNASMQQLVGNLNSRFNQLAGHQIATVTGHEAFKYGTMLLLLLAGLAFLSALMRLAGNSTPIAGPTGVGAIVYVLFRIVDRPGGAQGFVDVSLGYGIWVALAGGAAILAGRLWPAASGGGPRTPKPAPVTTYGTQAQEWREQYGWNQPA